MKNKKQNKKQNKIITSLCLHLGYRYTINEEALPALLDSCLKCGIEAETKADGAVLARGNAAKKLEAELQKMEIAYKKELNNRFLRSFFSVFSPVGTMIGAVLFFVGLIIFNGFVFDVRAEGIPYFSEAEVLREAEDAGIYVGARWKKIDRDEAENRILLSSERVGWVSITRKGAVALIKVREKQEGKTLEMSEKTVNIVADRDAIVEEITVESGYAVVKPGDVVHKGDLLISGVLPESLGGGIVSASGSVRGKVTETIEAFAENVGKEKVYGREKTLSFSLNILGKTLNIFKNSGNSDFNCDIMKEIRIPTAFGGAPLPIRIEREYCLLYTEKTSRRTEEEMMSVSASRLKNELFARYSDADVLSVKTSGADVSDGYLLTSDVLIATEIGVEKEFYAS